MKFHFGKIPDTVDFSPEEENWTPLKGKEKGSGALSP